MMTINGHVFSDKFQVLERVALKQDLALRGKVVGTQNYWRSENTCEVIWDWTYKVSVINESELISEKLLNK